MIYILNLNSPRSFDSLLEFFNEYGGTNLDFLLEDFEKGVTNWSVPQKGNTW